MFWGIPTLIESYSIEESINLCKELNFNFVELNMNLPQYQLKNINVEKLKTLKKEYDECFEEHRETLKKINFLDNKISEIYKVIALSEKDVDPNFSLFSPVVTASGRLNENLYEEVHSMENELQQIKFL